MRHVDVLGVLAAIAAGFVTSVATALPPPNDLCANPAPITGNGPFAFDLTTATTGRNAVVVDCPGLAPFEMRHDVWFCWTSTCNGLVEFSTCGQTQVDTAIRLFQGCACPLTPSFSLCCGDNECGKQTKVICDAVCGQEYLIQLGTVVGGVPAAGTFTITCLESDCGGGTEDPHPEPHKPESCVCCGGRPEVVDSLSAPFNPGAIAAATNISPTPSAPAATLFDLGNQGAAPIGTNTAWNTGRYSHPTWSMADLGSVFGVTIDDSGNVYVAHTAVYGALASDPLGALGGAGSIYLLDGATGVASEFIRLPNQLDASLPVNEQYPGLGQLDFDCPTGKLYASNFEDGRIYVIDSTGAITSTFDHASNTVTGPLSGPGIPEPGDPVGFAPLGERVWAVRATPGRLYYSVWVEDVVQPNATADNQVWSVVTNANGDIVGPKSLELVSQAPVGGVTNPIGDIDFDDNCCMLIAERGMAGDTSTTPHIGYVRRYCFDVDPTGFVWTLDPTQFSIGPAGSTNAVGGVGWEGAPNNTVWAIGDAIVIDWSVPNNIYGLEGMPDTGGDASNSVLIDYDNNITFQQKTQLGSLEISCVEAPCATLHTEELLCGPDGAFTWTFTFTNNSGSTASVLILPDPSMTPHVIPLNPPIANGNSSGPITVTITGQQPGTEFCFDFVLGDVDGDECCHLEPCIELPDCEWREVTDVQVSATAVPGQFTLNFTFTNLEPYATGHLVLWPTAGVGTVLPNLINLGPVPPFGSTGVGPITVSGAGAPGSTFCLTVGNHSENWLECCFFEICVTVPNPKPGLNPADLNGDGSVNAADLGILLGAWGSRGPGDLDGDGVVGASDLGLLLGAWG